MKKLLILSILLLVSGCGFMARLDSMNKQMSDAIAKLDESNRLLSSAEKNMGKLSKNLP